MGEENKVCCDCERSEEEVKNGKVAREIAIILAENKIPYDQVNWIFNIATGYLTVAMNE